MIIKYTFTGQIEFDDADIDKMYQGEDPKKVEQEQAEDDPATIIGFLDDFEVTVEIIESE